MGISFPPSDNRVGPDLSKFKMTKCSAGYRSGSYEFPDETICKMIEQIKTDIQDLVEQFPPVREHDGRDILQQLLVPENAQLVRYIGCLAQAGPTVDAGWRDVLSGQGARSSRNAIVFAVVGAVLKEHVFSELFIAAPPAFQQTLATMERRETHSDGLFLQVPLTRKAAN